MYDVLNRSPACSLVISPAAAALLFFRCQPRDLASPSPENGAREAKPGTLALVRGAAQAWGRALSSRPLPCVPARATASHEVPQIQIPLGLGYDPGGPQLDSTSTY